MGLVWHWLVDWLWSAVKAIGDILLNSWYVLWPMIWEWCQKLFLWVWGQLPTGLVDFLSQQPWKQFQTYLSSVDWFIPVYDTFAIFVTVAGLVGSIRLIRWGLAVIPGAISNIGS